MKSHMELPEIDEATGKRKELYDHIQTERGEGNVSSVFQAYGIVPEVGMQIFDSQNVLLDHGKLSRIFKLTLMVAMSELNKSDLCISYLGTIIKKMGVTDEQVDAIRRLDVTSLGFSEKEQGLFYLAIKANHEARKVTRQDWDHLRDDLAATDEEIMETLVSVNTVHNFNLITCATGGGKEVWYTYNMEDFEPEGVSAAAE